MKTHLQPPKRSAPFDTEPGYYEPAMLWLYGNVRLLSSKLVHVKAALGQPLHTPEQLNGIEEAVEKLILAGSVLVTGIHSPAHQRAAVVPLRWGSPRVLVLSGGFRHHLGPDLLDEPFRVARLWRYQFDARTDLVVSRRAPDRPSTFALHNPTVDRLIERIVSGECSGSLFGHPEF